MAKIVGCIYSMKYSSSSILAVRLEIPILSDSEVSDILQTERCKNSSLRYIHTNSEDKNPDEDK